MRLRTITFGVLVVLGGARISVGQGIGTVSFGNYGSPIATYLYAYYSPIMRSPVPLGGSSTGPSPTLYNYATETGNGNDWTVQLWGGAGANDLPSQLQPLPQVADPAQTTSATLANGVHDFAAGTWASGEVAGVPGTDFAGQVATLQIYLWYNDGGLISTWSQALADGVPVGVSATANVVLGGPDQTGPPVLPATLPDSLGNIYFTPIPEPTPVVLFVTGVLALLSLQCSGGFLKIAPGCARISKSSTKWFQDRAHRF